MARVATATMGLLFVLAALLQLNDPDPIAWIAVYGSAAAACALALRGGAPAWLAGGVGAAACLWAAALAPRVVGQIAPGDLFREMGMATLAIEEAREMLGLLVVGGAMAALLLTRSTPRRM